MGRFCASSHHHDPPKGPLSPWLRTWLFSPCWTLPKGPQVTRSSDTISEKPRLGIKDLKGRSCSWQKAWGQDAGFLVFVDNREQPQESQTNDEVQVQFITVHQTGTFVVVLPSKKILPVKIIPFPEVRTSSMVANSTLTVPHCYLAFLSSNEPSLTILNSTSIKS